MIVIARGKLTYITEIQRQQVNAMQFWGKHKDPLFDSYNFPVMNEAQREYWYRNKKYTLSKKCFGVSNLQHQFVGYIALRNIRWIRRISELGIVFDPNHINKGYGTDALKCFLKYYFENMKMKQLNLKVAIFNKRAEKCYENCGFQLQEIKYDEFEDQKFPVFEKDELKEYQQFFKKEGTILLTQYKHMCITKERYIK
ncbi:GNAT family N-acetyltransferase [Clostridium formicaceticum]|uniref:Acetyltransferase (GNAT) family protein n=2 Tax=Clostridium formicaceticum TaxID=1497 RepID=A0AAC9WI55_9CLOT|nr:GNAT family protein [Clostridium formicaceticum]ARE89802.1 Acetyltransferase (GNAT) family protein [Clostridium formicaceticum]